MDLKEIRNNLQRLSKLKDEKKEELRLQTRTESIAVLQKYFLSYPECQVWLFGSITRPYCFSQSSDIDIAVKGYPGSRLDLYCELDALIRRSIDLVMLEKTSIADEIIQQGERII